jgi:hypothetical protein
MPNFMSLIHDSSPSSRHPYLLPGKLLSNLTMGMQMTLTTPIRSDGCPQMLSLVFYRRNTRFGSPGLLTGIIIGRMGALTWCEPRGLLDLVKPLRIALRTTNQVSAPIAIIAGAPDIGRPNATRWRQTSVGIVGNMVIKLRIVDWRRRTRGRKMEKGKERRSRMRQENKLLCGG